MSDNPTPRKMVSRLTRVLHDERPACARNECRPVPPPSPRLSEEEIQRVANMIATHLVNRKPSGYWEKTEFAAILRTLNESRKA